jgi:hypothetical protein
MTQPAGPILGAVHLDDGINTRFRWNEETGLSSPATRAIGSIQSTFGGPVRVIPTAVAYPAKDLDLPGYLLQVNGLAEGYDRLDRLYNLAGTAGSVSILQMGALGLEVIPEAPVVERLKAHRVQLDFSMKGTAIPATWTALFGSYLGAAYGIVANGESLINLAASAPAGQSVGASAFALAAGASPAVTNAGTAPTPLVLTISVSGPRTTRFFVRCTAPGYTKRISVTPVSGGVVTITEAHGLFVPPGSSVLRYEEANGTLITGTIASSIYGTRWRYEGLEETLSEVGPVVLYNTRQQRAYAATSAFTTSAGLTLYGPDVPRFGNSGTYDAADAGLVVEPDRTNLILQSQALGTTWVQSMVTVTNNNGTAPDGTTTGTRVQFTAGMLGSLTSQSVTLTAAPYVVSFYARSTSAGTQNFSVSMGAILATSTVTTGTNWARYQFLVPGTAAAYSLAFSSYEPSPMIYDAADVQIWGVQVELATGQTAANATSYIPTTSTTQRRFADIVGVRPLENLLAYSNRFDKQTTTSTTRGLWYIAGGVAPVTATRQVGPSGVTDASSLAFAGANAGLQQRLINAEQFADKTVVFSIWVKNNTSTPDSDGRLIIEEFGTGAGTTTVTMTNMDDSWRRWTVQRKISAGVTDVSIQIRSNGAITYYFAHAHVYIGSEGTYNLATSDVLSLSGPYIETQASPVYRARGWEWPEWLTQNGYVEADICLSETANPNSDSRTFLLAGSTAGLTPTMHQGYVRRSSATASGSNEIGFGKANNAGTAGGTYTPGSSLYDGAFHKYRLEWVNYTVSGSRTISLRLYVDSVQVASGTTGGATSWLRPPVLQILSPTGGSPGFQTMKNIAIGSPVLPAGAIPAPY